MLFGVKCGGGPEDDLSVFGTKFLCSEREGEFLTSEAWDLEEKYFEGVLYAKSQRGRTSKRQGKPKAKQHLSRIQRRNCPVFHYPNRAKVVKKACERNPVCKQLKSPTKAPHSNFAKLSSHRSGHFIDK